MGKEYNKRKNVIFYNFLLLYLSIATLISASTKDSKYTSDPGMKPLRSTIIPLINQKVIKLLLLICFFSLSCPMICTL